MTAPFKHYDPDWIKHAACRGVSPSVFYYEDTSPNHEARRLCISCPVRLDCAELAVDTEKDWGVWAGITARVRLTLRRLMLRTNTGTVQELLATKPDVVLSMYPAPKRTYRRNPDKPSPISTNTMFVSLIEAAKIRRQAESEECSSGAPSTRLRSK